MKKLLILLVAAVCSMLMMAQTQQITWVNGRAVMGQSIESIDSLKYGTMTDADQLVLWLPKTIIVHDTIVIRDYAPAGVEMVDLGLSVKWANMNIGATVPEEYGDYFAWGETDPKTDYSWGTYKYCNGSSSTMTKYCKSSSCGTVDNKTTLEAEDDAAHVNWGGTWRMPTNAELTELREQCTWTWTTLNGVNGYRVTGTNGNSIFLPAAGSRYDTYLYNAGSGGYYWSSSLYEIYEIYSNYAYDVYFNSGNVYGSNYYRDYGHSVRPVCP